MSWSIFILDLPPEIKSPLEIPRDFKLLSLGSATEVLSTFAETFPEAEVNLFTEKNLGSRGTWLRLSGENFGLMFNLEKDETGTIGGLYLSSEFMDVSFENLIQLLQRLWEHTRWRVIDMPLGTFINFDAEEW